MDCPECAREMWAVQYRGTSQDYDGTSEWSCGCGVRVGRWSKKQLNDGQIERRCGGEPVTKREQEVDER